MSDTFTHGSPIACPECPGVGPQKRKPWLQVAERNYSGCSVDMGCCEECGKAWEISFKVDTMTRAPRFDDLTRVEQEAEIAQEAKETEAQEREEMARLKAKYEKDAPHAE